jgi:hypothetical protein
MIKFVDEQDQTLKIDARKLLGVPHLEGQIVVIRGRAKRDEAGNLTVVASKYFVRPKGQESKPPESEKP